MDTRPATAADIDAVTGCVDAAYRPFVEEIGRTPAPMLDDYAELIERRVVDVVEVDSVVLGVIVHWAAGGDGDRHWYVDNVAVDPRRQGRGVGRRLIDHAVAAARDAGLGEVRLYTNVAMEQNQAWYPRLGFVETHRALDRGYSRIFYALSV